MFFGLLCSFERDACLTKRVHEHTKEMLERFKLPVIPTHDAIRSELLTAKKSMDEVSFRMLYIFVYLSYKADYKFTSIKYHLPSLSIS